MLFLVTTTTSSRFNQLLVMETSIEQAREELSRQGVAVPLRRFRLRRATMPFITAVDHDSRHRCPLTPMAILFEPHGCSSFARFCLHQLIESLPQGQEATGPPLTDS